MDRPAWRRQVRSRARRSREACRTRIHFARLFLRSALRWGGCTRKAPRVQRNCTACSCGARSRNSGIAWSSQTLPAGWRRIQRNGRRNATLACSGFADQRCRAWQQAPARAAFRLGWNPGSLAVGTCGLPSVLLFLPTTQFEI